LIETSIGVILRQYF